MTNSQFTKQEYLNQLENKLSVLPENERRNAIYYYNKYITDSNDEAATIAKLGTPSDVASEILAGYVKRGSQPPPVSTFDTSDSSLRKRITDNWWLLIILAIFAGPVLLGIGGGILGIITGIGAALFAFAVSGVTMVATGAVSIVLSVFILFQDIGFGLITAGSGFVLVGVGILLVQLAIAVFKWMLSVARKILRRLQNGRQPA